MAANILTTMKRKLLPRTLFGRSLMIIATPILLLQLILAFVFFDRHWDAMSDKLVNALAGEVQMTAGRLKAAKNQKQVDEIIAQSSTSLEMIVTVEKGARDGLRQPELPFAKFYWVSVGQKLQDALDRKLHQPFIIRPYEKARWFEIVVQLDKTRQAHFICADKRLISPTTYIFILWMIGSAIVLLAIAVLFMRNQIRPIMRLAVAAEKLGKGQDVPDFKPVGAREVRQASRAFLDMKERLKRQMEQRTAMLSGVSHDLRTPLTRMKLQLAMAKKGAETDNLRQDIEEMERMIEGYLTFARGEIDETPAMTDMRAVLERIIARTRRQGCDVQAQLDEGGMMLRVRPLAMERAIANIVSNACKYAKHVWLTAHPGETMLEIMVDDDGPGVPQDLRDEVFRPFYRVEKSRNKKTGGVGLGLSIAQDIVHSHGGEIFMEDSNRGGVRVVMRLPF
ncbi:MAG: HAMP domain-containing protein [Alphaproteobacteria bacterium]|nr:HAMP domain-containing protein [Alphaproteobacteria bacterium]